MILRLPLMIILLFGLSSCAETPTLQDTQKETEVLKVEYPQRLKADVTANCKEDVCTIKKSNIETLVKWVNGLQDDIEKRIDAYNGLVDAISHYKFSLKLREEQVKDLKSSMRIQQLTCAGKQILLLGICTAGVVLP